MTVRIDNVVIDLDEIAFLTILYPSEDETNGCIELLVRFKSGAFSILCGDIALTVWNLKTKHAKDCTPDPEMRIDPAA